MEKDQGNLKYGNYNMTPEMYWCFPIPASRAECERQTYLKKEKKEWRDKPKRHNDANVTVESVCEDIKVLKLLAVS